MNESTEVIDIMTDLKSQVLDKKLSPFERLKLLMKILRSDQGCSWDRKQTHKSLIPYLVEESYEVIEAIESGDPEAVCEELGDLICQALFHAQIASENGEFEIEDSLNSIVDKLILRHPHVFENRQDLDPKQVKDQWEKIKIESGGGKKVLAGLPLTMPALLMAYRIGQKAGGVGFDWPTAEEVFEKIEEEITEIKQAIAGNDSQHLSEEIGDLLFAVASLARKLEVDPEQALKGALKKFISRFELLEKEIRKSGGSFKEYDLSQLEEIWQQIKKA